MSMTYLQNQIICYGWFCLWLVTKLIWQSRVASGLAKVSIGRVCYTIHGIWVFLKYMLVCCLFCSLPIPVNNDVPYFDKSYDTDYKSHILIMNCWLTFLMFIISSCRSLGSLGNIYSVSLSLCSIFIVFFFYFIFLGWYI